MNEIVYLDVFFLWNFLMDTVSLLLAGHIASEKAKLWRLILASAFGALVAVLTLFLRFGSFLTLLSGLVSFLPMIWIAFGRRSFRRLGFVSLFAFLSSLFLGGAMEALSYYAGEEAGGFSLGIFLAAVFFAFGAYSLWGRNLKRKLESRVISLSICHREKETQLYGLIDSGSFLQDPESGKPVILLKAEYAKDFLSPSELFSLQTGQGEGVIPIPIRTASGRGFLFAFSPEKVRLHRSEKKKRKKDGAVLVALDFSGGGFAGCPCLVPLSIV